MKKLYVFSDHHTISYRTEVEADSYDEAVDKFLSGDGDSEEVNSNGGDWECIDNPCLLYTSPSPRDATLSRMPSSA